MRARLRRWLTAYARFQIGFGPGFLTGCAFVGALIGVGLPTARGLLDIAMALIQRAVA